MWIVTEHGFFTFVQDRKDPAYLWLRARVREDLERNFPTITVEEHPGADYLYRARVLRSEVAARIAELVMQANITSHFKDEVNKRASKPEFGSRSSAMYAFWNGMAACQPYAPYSKVPRTHQPAKTWSNSPADRRPGTGQTALPSSSTGRYASEFDWDANAWGGVSHPDPAKAPSAHATDEEFETWWNGLTDHDRDRYLDAEEETLRRREEMEEDFGAAARAFEVADVLPSPRNRPGSRKARRKAKRANRHNQYRNLGFSDSQASQEAVNRQTYLDNKHRNGGA